MGGEWSLVAFTITGQLAWGLYVFVGIPVYFGLGDAGARLGREGRLEFLLAVLALLTAATALSLFHLHHPVKAYRTLVNLGRSWLSREILCLVLFGAAVSALAISERTGIGGPGAGRRLFVLGGLAGFLFVLTMSRLYMLPSVPTWNEISTPLSFFLTSAALGAVAAAFLLSRRPALPPAPRPVLMMALFGLCASLLNAVLLAPAYGLFGAKPRPSLRPPGTGSACLHAVRLCLLAAGGALLMIALATGGQGSPSWSGRSPATLSAAFVLAVAGEVTGRFQFYGLSGRRK